MYIVGKGKNKKKKVDPLSQKDWLNSSRDLKKNWHVPLV
jgi:hypothetical protein